jgi:hypothetical protein
LIYKLNALGINALGVNALGVNALGVNALGVKPLGVYCRINKYKYEDHRNHHCAIKNFRYYILWHYI